MRLDVRIAGLTLLAILVGVAAFASAGAHAWQYGDKDLRGQWVLSGDLQFAAPIPFPGSTIQGAPPHASFAPGDVVGIQGSVLGTMDFDGKGIVTAMKEVFKPGGIEPAPGFPLRFIPPLPEVGEGTYAVQSDGTVQIDIDGRDPNNPEGQVDFESVYHCQLNRFPSEMQCVYASFKTYFVDPNGYYAPISGIVTFRKRH